MGELAKEARQVQPHEQRVGFLYQLLLQTHYLSLDETLQQHHKFGLQDLLAPLPLPDSETVTLISGLAAMKYSANAFAIGPTVVDPSTTIDSAMTG